MIKIISALFAEPLEIIEHNITDLIIEDSEMFYNFLSEINETFKKTETDLFRIEVKGEVINIANKAEFFYEYFNFDINSRKIKTELLKSLNKTMALVDYNLKISEINNQVRDLFDEIFMDYFIDLEYEQDLPVSSLFKIYELSVKTTHSSLIERIISWLKTYIELFKYEIFIFINLFHFISKEDLIALKNFCEYQKISVINISRHLIADFKSLNKGYILTRDFCVLPLD